MAIERFAEAARSCGKKLVCVTFGSMPGIGMADWLSIEMMAREAATLAKVRIILLGQGEGRSETEKGSGHEACQPQHKGPRRQQVGQIQVTGEGARGSKGEDKKEEAVVLHVRGFVSHSWLFGHERGHGKCSWLFGHEHGHGI